MMDTRCKYYYCKRCNLPTDHEIIKKLNIIFTQLEMHLQEAELLSLITNGGHQALFTAATMDHKVSAHIPL